MIQQQEVARMSLPDLEAVLAEVWQLALTVSSLKHISGLVTQELEAIRASTGEIWARVFPHFWMMVMSSKNMAGSYLRKD